MTIDRGKLSRLNDVAIPSTPTDGHSLIYNGNTGKWETKDLSGLIAQLAPSDANALSNTNFTGTPTMYTGKLPSGLAQSWYANGNNPGDTINSLVLTTKSTYATASPSNTFHDADQGVLALYINDVMVASIDLGANFNENNRSSSQNISQYNSQGTGNLPISSGVVTFNNGTFAIKSVEKYNNWTEWQVGNAQVVLNQELGEGYNDMYIIHQLASGNETTNKLIMFFDNDTTPMTFVSNPTVSEVAVTGKYLSGVKYYTTGDTFSINYTGASTFLKTYHATEVSDYNMPGISDVIKNPTSVPAVTDNFVVNDASVSINVSNIMTNNARLTANLRDPYGHLVSAQSPSEGRLVLTYPNRSTYNAEYFTDESYRLPLTFDFTSTTSGITGQWTSSNLLSNGDAQCYINNSNVPALIYPTTNFTSGFVPTNTANYSTFTGNQQYVRAFTSTSAQSSVAITLNGITGGLGQVSQGDVNIEIKLPGQSGWGDALKPYDSTVDKTADGWGMLAGNVTYGSNNTTLTATFGGLSTVNSGNRIYFRVTLLNSNRSITSMSVGW